MIAYLLFIGFALLVCALGLLWSLPDLIRAIDDRLDADLAQERADWDGEAA